MSPKTTRPLRKSSSAPPPARVKRGGAADSDDAPTSSTPPPRSDECPFCDYNHYRVILGNDQALALRDEYPVSKGHTLVVPRRHVGSWFAATEIERAAIIELVDRVRERLETADPTPDGYNIGINDGAAAGQTIMHLHVHLIPRYDGDVDDPRGGVRHVIPGRGNYLTTRPSTPPGRER